MRRVTTLVLAVAFSQVACPGDQPTEPPTGAAIQLSATTRSFSTGAGAAYPAPQTITIANAGTGILSSLTARIDYGGAELGWLSASLSSITAPATLTLQASTSQLMAGTYQATITIASPVAAAQQVLVTLHIAPATGPAIGMTRRPIEMWVQGTSGTTSVGLGISNVGTGTLSGLARNVSYRAGEPGGWLTATLSGATAPTSLGLVPSAAALSVGTYHATVSVTSAVAVNGPVALEVELEVRPPAMGGGMIALSPAAHAFTAVAAGNNPAAKTVQVTNDGSGSISGLATQVEYQAGQPTGWLAGALNTTTAPAVLTINATKGSLPVGTYIGKLWISSAGASNSPRAVDVTFTVLP
jgi:hypothetical protein